MSDQAVEQSQPRALEADRLIGRKELCRFLGVSYTTVWGWVRSGRFVPAFDVNGIPKWRLSDVRAWVDASLPPTLDDRCIPVRLQRRRADEVTVPFRHNQDQDLVRLCRMSGRWAADNLHILSSADPAVPPGLQNRAADNWRPLLSIADAAGGKWPKLARKIAASIEQSKQAPDQDPAVNLLEDIYAITQQSSAALTSENLVSALIRINDRPWADWKGEGRPITKKVVANLLAPFKIKPVGMRLGHQVLRGYQVGQFEDAFSRYVAAAAMGSAVPSKIVPNTRKSAKAVARRRGARV